MLAEGACHRLHSRRAQSPLRCLAAAARYRKSRLPHLTRVRQGPRTPQQAHERVAHATGHPSPIQRSRQDGLDQAGVRRAPLPPSFEQDHRGQAPAVSDVVQPGATASGTRTTHARRGVLRSTMQAGPRHHRRRVARPVPRRRSTTPGPASSRRGVALDDSDDAAAPEVYRDLGAVAPPPHFFASRCAARFVGRCTERNGTTVCQRRAPVRRTESDPTGLPQPAHSDGSAASAVSRTRTGCAECKDTLPGGVLACHLRRRGELEDELGLGILLRTLAPLGGCCFATPILTGVVMLSKRESVA